jgi:hypothetical protein
VGGEELAGVEVGNGDLVVVGEGEHAFAGVCGADSEVVYSAGAADCDSAFGVEAVVAQAVVGRCAPGGGSSSGAAVWSGRPSVVPEPPDRKWRSSTVPTAAQHASDGVGLASDRIRVGRWSCRS